MKVILCRGDFIKQIARHIFLLWMILGLLLMPISFADVGNSNKKIFYPNDVNNLGLFGKITIIDKELIAGDIKGEKILEHFA